MQNKNKHKGTRVGNSQSENVCVCVCVWKKEKKRKRAIVLFLWWFCGGEKEDEPVHVALESEVLVKLSETFGDGDVELGHDV